MDPTDPEMRAKGQAIRFCGADHRSQVSCDHAEPSY